MDKLKKELLEQIEKLSPGQQKQVLNTVLSFLGEPVRGTPIKEMLKFVGLFPPEDLEQIKQAIEEDCAVVDVSK